MDAQAIGEGTPAGPILAPLVDPSALAEICDGDTEMRRDLIDMFANQCDECLQRMASAIAAPDGEGLHEQAHLLKGSSGSMGALRMAELCASLCEAGRTRELSSAPRLLEELERTSRLTFAAWQVATPL